MADKPGLIVFEGGVAQYVVEVDVGIDYITDREGRYCFYGFPELTANTDGTTRIYNGDTFIPDDKADVGDIVVVSMFQFNVLALVDVNPLADLGQVERRIVAGRSTGNAAQQYQRQPCPGKRTG